jgi:cell division transport system permease protein
MIGLVEGGLLGLKSIQTQAKENLQGDIFFYSELNSEEIKQIQLELNDWPEFKEVQFISPARAMDEFSGSESQSKQIMKIFEGSNPLPSSVTYRPREKYANKIGMESLRQKLMKHYSSQIEEVSYDEASVTQVNLGFRQFVFLFLIVALLLIVVAVAMINNTIRLALYSKRFTIKTMQVVGATSSFIRKPFLIQALAQGVISAVVGMALLLALFTGLTNLLDSIELNFSLETSQAPEICAFILRLKWFVVTTKTTPWLLETILAHAFLTNGFFSFFPRCSINSNSFSLLATINTSNGLTFACIK